MTDTNHILEAAGLIPCALLDGKPSPETAWVDPEAIVTVGRCERRRFDNPKYNVAVHVWCFIAQTPVSNVAFRSDVTGPEADDTNRVRVEARRDEVLRLWAAARMKAKGKAP
jgi:hypothetical protein